METAQSLLFRLPPELLMLILSRYCSGKSLSTFWLALAGSQEFRKKAWSLVQKAVAVRVFRVNCWSQWNESCLKSFLPRGEFGSLSPACIALDYFEELSGVLWCGWMEFDIDRYRDPRNLRRARVLVYSPPCWKPLALAEWNTFAGNYLPLEAQLYNFVPIPPYGQLIGITKDDKAVLSHVSRYLQSQNQVLTVRSSCRRRSFILRVIGPEQARERLARFGSKYRPSNSWIIEKPEEGLVCSWEYPPEIEPSGEQVLESMKCILTNYHQARDS